MDSFADVTVQISLMDGTVKKVLKLDKKRYFLSADLCPFVRSLDDFVIALRQLISITLSKSTSVLFLKFVK